MPILERDFFNRHACIVARDLLGARLVRQFNGSRISGIIVETEAYTGVDDLASHGRHKQTPRNLPMWEAPGYAYVYLTYGMHWMVNAVCEPPGRPAAVLIRAIEPVEGLEFIQEHRAGRPPREWTSGPARLTMALKIDSSHNRTDITGEHGGLWIETGVPVADEAVSTGPRIGLGKNVSEPWFSIPWRWWITNNPSVSK